MEGGLGGDDAAVVAGFDYAAKPAAACYLAACALVVTSVLAKVLACEYTHAISVTLKRLRQLTE